MSDHTNAMLRSVSRASKRARQLHSSIRVIEHLLPESVAWHEMSAEARQLELRIETMLTMIEEILGRDPETYLALLLKLDDLQDSMRRAPNKHIQLGVNQQEL